MLVFPLPGENREVRENLYIAKPHEVREYWYIAKPQSQHTVFCYWECGGENLIVEIIHWVLQVCKFYGNAFQLVFYLTNLVCNFKLVNIISYQHARVRTHTHTHTHTHTYTHTHTQSRVHHLVTWLYSHWVPSGMPWRLLMQPAQMSELSRHALTTPTTHTHTHYHIVYDSVGTVISLIRWEHTGLKDLNMSACGP